MKTKRRESGFFYFVFDPAAVKEDYLYTRLDQINPNWTTSESRCSYLNQYNEKYHLAELSFQYESEYVHSLQLYLVNNLLNFIMYTKI